MGKKLSVTLSIILALGGFGAFYFFTGNTVLSFGAFCIGISSGFFMSSPKKKTIEYVIEGISKEDLDKLVKRGRDKVKSIEDYGFDIKKTKVRMDILHICDIAYSIFDDFYKDPKDIKIARKFLNYYLDTTEKIVKQYLELSNTYLVTPEIKETLGKVENTLVTIKETFQKQMEKLLENDLLDLDVEVKTLEQTIKSEGL